MSINLIDIIKQKNGAEFPLVEDVDFLGGFRVAATELDRDAIPASYRKIGMFVWTVDTNKLWRADTLTTWVEFTGGSGGGSSITDSLVAAEAIGAYRPVTLGASGLLQSRADTPGRQEVYGVSTNAATAAGDIVNVVTSGVMSGVFIGWTAGQVVYLSDTGTLTTTPPSSAGSAIVRIGTGRSITTLLVRVQPVAIL